MAKNIKQMEMDPVTEFIFASMQVDKETLRYLLSLLDGTTASRMVYALAGIFNPVKMIETMPSKSRVNSNSSYCDYSDCVFTSYNYLQDSVFYDYIRTSYRIFKSEEAAKKYGEKGDYDWRDGSSKEGRTVNEEYPYLGTYTSQCNSSTSYESWMKNAIIED